MDWYETEIAYDDTAVGASIRNWGPSGDVFVFVNHVDEVVDGLGVSTYNNETTIYHYECDAAGGGYEFCENATLIDEEDVGSTNVSSLPHAMHPASAVRFYSSGEQELTLSRNEEEGTYVCGAPGGNLVWDIVSYVYRTTSGSVVESLPIQRADSAAECEDHGKTEVKYDGATAHACYTTIDASGDYVQCNEDDGDPYEWSSTEDLTAASEEDHPTFVIDDNGDRITAVHAFNGSANHEILLRLADGTPVAISDNDDSKKNHPELSGNTDGIRVVYHHDPEGMGDFRIAYKGCNLSSTVDCSDYGYPGDPTDDWVEEYITDDVYGSNYYFQAKHAEHVKDLALEREFVAFQYNSYTASEPRLRVIVGTRCFGGSWDFEQPRVPDDVDDDQSLIYGTPGLVLNKNEKLVHVAFAELAEMDGNEPTTTDGGDAYWLRASYADLPSCL